LKLLGVSEETPFMRFQDQETAAIFDPPNLLKCTRKKNTLSWNKWKMLIITKKPKKEVTNAHEHKMRQKMLLFIMDI
jgi:hypothetical protein